MGKRQQANRCVYKKSCKSFAKRRFMLLLQSKQNKIITMNCVAHHPHHISHDSILINKLNHADSVKLFESYRQHILPTTKSSSTSSIGNSNGTHEYASPLRRAKNALQRFKLPMSPRKKQQQYQQQQQDQQQLSLSNMKSLSQLKTMRSSLTSSSSSVIASSPPPSHRIRRMSLSRKSKQDVITPQVIFDQILSSKGYSIERHDTLSRTSIYRYKRPTSYQNASYNTRLLKLIEKDDIEALSSLFTTGLSPNPFNESTGEYMIHHLCHNIKNWKIIKTMIQYGGSRIAQRCDMYGRTPLHILCMNATVSGPMSSPELVAIITTLLDCDNQLFLVTDCRHVEPLSYVRKEHYKEWIQFIQSSQFKYWPTNKAATTVVGEVQVSKVLSSSLAQPTICPRRGVGLTLEVVSLLASGKMDPEEVHYLRYDRAVAGYDVDDDDEEEELQEEENSSKNNNNNDVKSITECGTKTCASNATLETLLLDDDDDSSECSDEDDIDDSCSFGADEMADILNGFTM